MKIIDKNTDFYDYLQGIYPDDSVTFDRRDSYVLTKEEFASHFYADSKWSHILKKEMHNYSHFVLLQVFHNYYLFLLHITKLDDYDKCEDYVLSLLRSWQDYDNEPAAIKLSHIEPRFWWAWAREEDPSMGEKDIDQLVDAIHQHNVKSEFVFDRFELKCGPRTEIKRTPILKNIGIAALLDPQEIYFALDGYFSWLKTSIERTESTNITDKEKVVNHGFDVKTSFRGKHKEKK